MVNGCFEKSFQRGIVWSSTWLKRQLKITSVLCNNKLQTFPFIHKTHPFWRNHLKTIRLLPSCCKKNIQEINRPLPLACLDRLVPPVFGPWRHHHQSTSIFRAQEWCKGQQRDSCRAWSSRIHNRGLGWWRFCDCDPFWGGWGVYVTRNQEVVGDLQVITGWKGHGLNHLLHGDFPASSVRNSAKQYPLELPPSQ